MYLSLYWSSERSDILKMTEKIDFKKAKEIIDSEKNVILVDVREEPEYITGHAVDAVLFPVDEITAESAADILPDKTATYLIYCRSGRRSAIAAQKLSELGYTELYDMGSLIGWPYGLE